jgi:hypothetical protein
MRDRATSAVGREHRISDKRPNREREWLVGEHTRITKRIKTTLARLGIRNFKSTLFNATERLATVHTPKGMPLPPNALAELQRSSTIW